MSPFRRSVVLLGLFLLFSRAAFAQVPDPVVAAEAPRPGAGHHYIGMGAETVNPADGSLSFHLPLQPPTGRQISFTFGIRFAGTEQYFLKNWPTNGTLQWYPNSTYGSQPLQIGGWSYDIPLLTGSKSIFWSATTPNNGCPDGICTFGTNLCYGNDGYVFRGLDGNQYSVALGSVFPGTQNFTPGYCPSSPSNLKGPSNNHGVLAWYQSSSLTNVVDPSGTTYQFATGSGDPGQPIIPPGDPSMWGLAATTITDRNGNQLTATSNGYKDSAGRTAISWSGIGNSSSGDQITVSGLGPVTVKWTTTPVSFPETGTNLDASPNTCTLGGGSSSSIQVVSEIDLPNTQKYTFQYDGTYGKVSKITFPDGGYVRYVWGLNRSAKLTRANWSAGQPSTLFWCDFLFDVPAITDRYVSYDGTTDVLHQQFSYSSTGWSTAGWTQKQTTVTSTDLLTTQVTKTVYTYSPATTDNNVWVNGAFYTKQVPVETNVLYQDGTGKTFKEVNKVWLNPHVMTAEQTILYDNSGNRSVGSATTLSYDANEQLTGKAEYGFQTEGSCGTSCPTGLNTTYIGPLRRQTVNVLHPYFTWNGSTNPPTWSGTHIVNSPDSVTVKDGSNNTVKQTLFTYDQNSLQPSGAINLTNPGTTRANPTTVQLLVSASNYSTTTYTYFDTGQMASMTDPCGNTACSDMTGTNHTTNYDYTDHYASGTGTPPGQTFAYLTHVTRPNTGVAHSTSYTWGYNDGLIRSTTDDQNSLTSTYAYADPLLRVTQIIAPDGGQTNITYADTALAPTITTSKQFNNSQSIVSITVGDGLGHTVRSKLCEDGTTSCTQPIITDTTIDGLGRTWKQSNPYRSTGDATYGITTNYYDAIGRSCLVVPPGGTLPASYSCASQPTNTLLTAYSANVTTVTDQTGRSRRSRTDGLGFLVEVDEPGYGTTAATPGTGSATIGGSEQSKQYVCGPNNQMCTMYDGGTITVTINGTPYTGSYSQTCSNSCIASALATSMNGGTLVTATATGNVVNFTARTTGAATNYSLTTSVGWNQSNFPSPSYTATLSGSTMTGGTNSFTGYSLGTPAVTLYTYDTLGNLTCAVQKSTDTMAFSTCAAASATWRPRSFSYDMLSHMLTSANPEVGTLTYTYDLDGNVSTKKDARNITSTYTYDVLSRNKTVTYSNLDPSISTNYDEPGCLGLATCQNVGQRTSMTDAAGSESWAYHTDNTNSDMTKRNIHVNQRTTGGITKPSTYYLDLAGHLTQIVYPTGTRTVNYAYDNAGRAATATDSANGITYASGTCSSTGTAICYAPQGALASAKIGVSSVFTGGLVLTNTYNNRLQPNELKASSSGGNAFDITYNFVDSTSMGNAGHVYGITNNIDNGRSQTFTYDQLNRITSAQTTSTFATAPTKCWGETYTVDAWANLTAIAQTTNPAYTGCTEESGFTKTADNFNHLYGFGYDLSGNSSSDGTIGYSWDGESQLKSATNAGVTTNYTYDGNGRRTAKVGSKFYWYGSGGEILAETNASGATTNEYIFFGGKRIALLPNGSTAQFYAEDFLGSSRVVTTNTGIVCYDADFYPYGGERTPYTNTCTQNAYKFEGKERDAETGNDDFGARYYSNRFGRWLSADWSSVPAPIPYANLTNPQTLNLYSMVADDPESFADLDGHFSTPVFSEQPGGCAGSVSVYREACGPDDMASAESEKNHDKQQQDQNQAAQQASQGAAISSGAVLTNDGVVRANYAQQASQLSGPEASAARAALQKEAYKELSPVGQGITDALKQSRTGQLAGKTAAELAESASRTNAVVNAVGGASKVAGPVLLVAGAGVSAYNIATAPRGQRGRVMASEGGAWAGALAGGALGAKGGAIVGSFFGPGVGTAVGAGIGALVGGGLGAIGGSHLGRAIYDWATH